jgi:dihydroorotate dehydrogenase (NAD+) catalytic subunit
MSSDIGTEIAGLRLRNPFILAAGILGITGHTLRRVAEAGAGAVVTKSLGLEPRMGYPNPTVVEVQGGLLNAMGLPNPGIDTLREEIEEVRKTNVPVIASVYGCSETDYAEAASKVEAAGADAVELNVSCPHVKEVGTQIGQDPDLVSAVTASVKSSVKLPVIVKLTPNITSIVEIARKAVEGGADAITAINTVKALSIDIDVQKPILAAGMGGLSGPAIKPIALRCVYEIHKAVDVPLIGCGGVTTWSDAVEFFLAGASAVQIGTAIMYRDLDIFPELQIGLRKYLERKELGNIQQLIGLACINQS